MDRQYRVCRVFLAGFFLSMVFSANSATVVGNTSGTFVVSTGGNATYQLSLSLPPGTAGMQPELALAYSSGAGDGVAGWGWHVGGLSSIRRCAATYAQNGRAGSVAFDSGDRLCLDGNQLMLVSGTYLAAGAIYRSELDNFTKVTQVGSGTSAYFKAEQKDGRILFFGSATDSRILRDGNTAVHTWALSKVTDRSANRNFISFSYSLDAGGQYLPESVKYTGSDVNTPYYDVDFVYEARPSSEARIIYRAGSDAGYTKRLDRIDVKYNTTVVRSYQLTYESSLSPVTERSRLASIQECGTVNAITGCYNPVTFEWLDASASRGADSSGWSRPARWADINGDGLDDAVFHGGVIVNPDWNPDNIFDDEYLYTKMAYALSTANGELDNPVDTDIPWDNDTAKTAQILDFDGDGRMEVAFERDGNVAIARWNSGFSDAAVLQTNVTYSANLRVLDVDGDGYDDIVKPLSGGLAVYPNKFPSRPAGYLGSDYYQFTTAQIDPQGLMLSSASTTTGGDFTVNYVHIDDPEDPWSPPPSDPYEPPNYPTVSNVGESSDIDGDGREDFLLPISTDGVQEWFVAFSRSTETSGQMLFASLGALKEPQLGDVNGDGLADLVYLSSTNVAHVRLSKGLGSASASVSFAAAANTGVTVAPYATDGGESYFQYALVDVNLDGMQDLMFMASIDDGTTVTYHWKKALSTGADFGGVSDSGLGGDIGRIAPPQLGVLDQNGDGVIDLVVAGTLNKAGSGSYYARGDRLSGVTGSNGLGTTISYAPLLSVHDWSGQGTVADAYRLRPRREVVDSYTSDNGDGGTFTVEYAYSGGLMDRRGRGFLGFTSRTAEDSRLPLRTKTKYRQDFPYTGMTSFVETVDTGTGNRVTFTQSGLTRQCFMEGVDTAVSCADSSFTAAQEKRYHRYAGNVVEQTYAANPASGALVRSVRTDRWTLDEYGNPQYTRVSYSGFDQLAAYDPQGIRTTTDTAYQNDTTGGLWCLGMPTQQATSATTDGVTEYRTDTAAYLNCRLQSKTTGDGTTKPVTTSYTYDDFGNVETETLSASGETSRVTTYDWSLDGRFLEATTNALGHSTAFTWYPETGLPKTQTDPNGLLVTWVYDELGNRTHEKRADGTETVWTRVYCSTNCGVTNGEYQVTETQQLTGVSGSHFARTQTIVDALDRVLEIRQPGLNATATGWGAGWSAIRTAYDALGRLQGQSMPFDYGTPDASLHWNERLYDTLGRIQDEDLANGGTRHYTYLGLTTDVTEVISEDGGVLQTATTRRQTDPKGRVIRVTDALNGTTTYHYDGFDNLTDTYAPGNSHIHIVYDDRGFKDVMNDPDMGSWDYDYNAFGELVSQTDAKGQNTTLTYDALGRLKTRTETEGVTTWTYDGPGGAPAVSVIGRLYNVSQVEGGVEKYAETYMYDSHGRPLNVTTTIDGAGYDTTYEYDVYGRLASVEYPESVETVINEAPVANAYAPSLKVLPGSVTLDGSASTDDNVPAALAYQWSQTTGPTVALSGAASSSATFTPTVPGAYGFTLNVTDSELSDQASVALEVRSPAPGRPDLPSTSTSASYTVTWTAPSAGVTASTTYQLQEATNSGFTSGLRTIPTNTTSASITERANTVTYYYRVRACEGSVCSGWSSTEPTEIRLPPGTPGTLSATPASTDIGNITLSWGASSGNVTKYQLQEANGSFSNGTTRIWDVTGTVKSITQTTPGTWVYRVRAVNDTVAGSNGNTDSVSVTLPATLATPTVSGINTTDGTYTVSWNSGGSGVVRYELYRRFDGTLGGDYDWYVHNAGTTRTLSASDVDEGTYQFRVRTCKATGCGAWSGILSFYVDRLTPKPGDDCEPFCSAEASGTPEGEATDSTKTSEDETSATGSASESSTTSGETSSSETPAASGDEASGVSSGNDTAALSPASLIEAQESERTVAARPVNVNHTGNDRFRAMHPARPYDLARAAASKASETTPARAMKTSLPALAATAAVTTTGYRFKVAYEYDTWSHLKRVKNAEPNGTVYWEAHSTNAMGQIVDEQAGNGVMTTHVYNPASGTLEAITSTNASAQAVQALEYDWDTAGNLTERRDQSVAGGLTEHFYYDALNRLDDSTLTGPSFSGTNLDLSYDAAGNIVTKSGVGTYTYGSTRPHALTSLAKTGGGTDTFTYDANGNLLTGAGKTYTWTSYNYPRRIVKGTTAVNFAYGPARQRTKEEQYSGSTLQTRTRTVNSYFEKVEEPAAGATTYKHYIHAAGKVVAVHDRKSDFHHTTNYLHRDHLGSVDTVTDKDGNVVARMSFDAFGQRRGSLDWNAGLPGSSELEQIRDLTTRGYTDHQMIDSLNLIHMNGRVYDPELGRFISADPFIARPHDTQGFNRYAYVQNNPLTYTDPSGFALHYSETPLITESIEMPAQLNPVTVRGSQCLFCVPVPLWMVDFYGRRAWNSGGLRNGTSSSTATAQIPGTSNVEVVDNLNAGQGEDAAQLETVVVEGQRLDVNTMVANDIERFVLRTFATLSADMGSYSDQRGLLYDRHRANVPVGSVIRERDGQLTASRPDPFAAQGLEPDGRMHFVSGLTPIRQATALVIGLPGFRTEQFLIGNANFYNTLSAQIGGPVYVGTTGRHRGAFYVFGGN